MVTVTYWSSLLMVFFHIISSDKWNSNRCIIYYMKIFNAQLYTIQPFPDNSFYLNVCRFWGEVDSVLFNSDLILVFFVLWSIRDFINVLVIWKKKLTFSIDKQKAILFQLEDTNFWFSFINLKLILKMKPLSSSIYHCTLLLNFWLYS